MRELQHGDIAVRVPGGEQRRRPVRLQMRIGFCGPSSRYSGAAVWVIVPPLPSLVYASMELLPITRSLGMPYTSSLIGRMKSRPPPEAM
jgi:hypothetical protein